MAAPLKVEFHFDFGSPNAYLAELALPGIEQRTGVKFDYVPVLLGGVYKATGNLSPAESLRGIKNKPEYNALETQRFLRRHNITKFTVNPFFPVNTLALMRGAVAAEFEGAFEPYFRAAYHHMIAIPSTLSGGEYNSGALVTDTGRKLKQIFNHPMMMPRTIILDAAITKYTPEKLWLGSGTRAMDHGIEAICSSRPNVLVDAVCQQGLRYLYDGLRRTKDNPNDEAARLNCQLGSWMSAFGLQSRVPMGASHAQAPRVACCAELGPKSRRESA